MNTIAPYAKAITGAIVAGLASAQQALADGSINSSEGIGVAIATLTALALVWAIPNADVVTSDEPEEDEEDEEDTPLSYEDAGGLPYPQESSWGSEREAGAPDRY